MFFSGLHKTPFIAHNTGNKHFFDVMVFYNIVSTVTVNAFWNLNDPVLL